MNIEEKIRNHLATYRHTHGIKSQKEMARIIGISYTTYQELEKGIVKKVDTLNKLKASTGFNEKNVYTQGFAGEEFVKLKEEIIELNAFANVVLPVISKLSAKDERVKFETRFGELQKAIDDEYDRLHKKYLRELERDQE